MLFIIIVPSYYYFILPWYLFLNILQRVFEQCNILIVQKYKLERIVKSDISTNIIYQNKYQEL